MAVQTFHVSRAESGRSLAGVLVARFQLTPSEAHRLVREGLVRIGGSRCTEADRRLRPGLAIAVDLGGQKPKSDGLSPKTPRREENRSSVVPLSPSAIRHVDAHLVVVDKPPGLTTMRHAEEAAEFGPRGQRFLPPTLLDLLIPLLGRGGRPRAVHRIDKDTSGLVVFARTAQAEQHLNQQFREHSVERRYLAVVRGQAVSTRWETWIARDRGDGRRGSITDRANSQRAVTHVRVLESFSGFSLVECRLETGRTHQVRIHLGEAGTPLCGERVYDRPLHGRPFPDGSGAARAMLHATRLGITHPVHGERGVWDSEPPEDMMRLVKRLRENSAHFNDNPTPSEPEA